MNRGCKNFGSLIAFAFFFSGCSSVHTESDKDEDIAVIRTDGSPFWIIAVDGFLPERRNGKGPLGYYFRETKVEPGLRRFTLRRNDTGGLGAESDEGEIEMESNLTAGLYQLVDQEGRPEFELILEE